MNAKIKKAMLLILTLALVFVWFAPDASARTLQRKYYRPRTRILYRTDMYDASRRLLMRAYYHTNGAVSSRTIYNPYTGRRRFTNYYNRRGQLYSRLIYWPNGKRARQYFYNPNTRKITRTDYYTWGGKLYLRNLFRANGTRLSTTIFNWRTGKRTFILQYDNRGRFTRWIRFTYYESGNLKEQIFSKPTRAGVTKITYYDERYYGSRGRTLSRYYKDGMIITYEYWDNTTTVKVKRIYDNQTALDFSKEREIHNYDQTGKLVTKRVYTHEDIYDWLYDNYYTDYTYDSLSRLIVKESRVVHWKDFERFTYTYFGDTNNIKTKTYTCFKAPDEQVWEYYESGNLKEFKGYFLYRERYLDEDFYGNKTGRLVELRDYHGKITTYTYWDGTDVVKTKVIYDNEEAFNLRKAREVYDYYPTGKLCVKTVYTHADVNSWVYDYYIAVYFYDSLERLVRVEDKIIITKACEITVYEYYGDTNNIKRTTTTDWYLPGPIVRAYYESGLLKEYIGYMSYYEKYLDEDNDGDGKGRIVEFVNYDGTRHVYSDHFEGSDQYKYEKVYDAAGNITVEYEYNESGTCIFRRDYEYIENFSDYVPVAEYTYYDSGNLKTKKTSRHSSGYLGWPAWEIFTYMDEDFYGDGTGRVYEYYLNPDFANIYGRTRKTYTEYWEGTDVAKKMHLFVSKGSVHEGEYLYEDINKYYTYHSSGLMESMIFPDPHTPTMRPAWYYHYLDEDWDGTGQGRMDIEIVNYPPDSVGAIAYEYTYHGDTDVVKSKKGYQTADYSDPAKPVLTTLLATYEYDINGDLIDLVIGSMGQDPLQAPKGVSIDMVASKQAVIIQNNAEFTGNNIEMDLQQTGPVSLK